MLPVRGVWDEHHQVIHVQHGGEHCVAHAGTGTSFHVEESLDEL